MPTARRIIFTVSNDLSYDQRMIRICGTLAEAGHQVTLVGRALPHSIPLIPKGFAQKRLRCFAQRGMLFYAEYNLRLLWLLLWARFDAVGVVDFDTLPAGTLASLLRRKRRVFDAHEYFTEVPELAERPFVRAFWALVGRCCLPFYRHAYTVGDALANIFSAQHRMQFGVVRNVPFPTEQAILPKNKPYVLLYQGALNAGRGIESALQAMQHLDDTVLWLVGEGDCSQALRAQAQALKLGGKVRFWGHIPPSQLPAHTQQAWIGLNLLENKGLSYFYSLANKFFDYTQAGIPCLTMDFPEYRALNAQYEVALLLPDLDPARMAASIRQLMGNPAQYQALQQNCLLARRHWNWENEREALLRIWDAALVGNDER
jgi:glycosyltransferase involved in cell wall biosynthesis